MPDFTIDTSHGLISVTDTALKNDNPTILLLHGNSSSAKIFRHIFDSEDITSAFRVVAFDYPGHGASSNAPEPDKSYSMSGYADLAVHVLQHLNIAEVVVFGWSLGGHVGIELIPLLQAASIQLRGLMITGTPPALGLEQTNAGFLFEDGHLSTSAKLEWSEEDVDNFAKTSAAAGKPELCEDWMIDNARRTDGRARMMMWKKFANVDGKGNGQGADQRKVVEETDVLIAVVNGAEEQFVNLDYLDAIKWRNLWKGKCERLEGLKHAPFWEEPQLFNGLLYEFATDVSGHKE
ncbi:hypothetical protein ACN47E_002151 [Coniothyrium glycines]